MKFMQQLKAKFECKDLEELNRILNIKGSNFNDPMDNKIRIHKNGATQLRLKQKEIKMEEGTVNCDPSSLITLVTFVISNLLTSSSLRVRGSS